MNKKIGIYLAITGGCVMATNNEVTLQSYEKGIANYVEKTTNTVSGVVKNFIDTALLLLPKEARIIEIGSGFGRDAAYIESHGFTVERTDAAHAFVELLQNKGYQAQHFNVITDEFTRQYDLVFANAVFLHFTRAELAGVLNKAYKALASNGILAFSVKMGEGEEWTSAKVGNPRYFCYWQLDALTQILEKSGFEIIQTFEDSSFVDIIACKK